MPTTSEKPRVANFFAGKRTARMPRVPGTPVRIYQETISRAKEMPHG